MNTDHSIQIFQVQTISSNTLEVSQTFSKGVKKNVECVPPIWAGNELIKLATTDQQIALSGTIVDKKYKNYSNSTFLL